MNASPIQLLVKADIRWQIEQAARGSYPEECCGILLGRDDLERGVRTVVECVFCGNHAPPEQRRQRFLIDPRELLQVDRQAARNNLEIVGFIHSHPDQAPVPSEIDRAMAWPFYSQVIVAVDAKGGCLTRAWMLDDRSGSMCEQLLIVPSD